MQQCQSFRREQGIQFHSLHVGADFIEGFAERQSQHKTVDAPDRKENRPVHLKRNLDCQDAGNCNVGDQVESQQNLFVALSFSFNPVWLKAESQRYQKRHSHVDRNVHPVLQPEKIVSEEPILFSETDLPNDKNDSPKNRILISLLC